MKKILIGAVALSVLAGAGAAGAQPYGYQGHQNQGYQSQGDRYDRYDNRYDNRYDRGDNRYDRGDNSRYGQSHHRYRSGQRLPSAYRTRGHYVDYRRHHLRQPPRGYQWVQYDNDYMMVALTTGLIAAIIAGR